MEEYRQKALMTSESINHGLKQHVLLILVMLISHSSILEELADSDRSDYWLFHVEPFQGCNSHLSTFNLECAIKILFPNIKLLS